jgi:hypothetical protein
VFHHFGTPDQVELAKVPIVVEVNSAKAVRQLNEIPSFRKPLNVDVDTDVAVHSAAAESFKIVERKT